MKRFYCFLLTLCVLLTPLCAFASDADAGTVLDETLRQLAADTRAQPTLTFGSEWAVFTLVRSGYLRADDPVAEAYYANLVSAVDETASATARKDGALHDVKSTDSSRVILALSAIGKDPHKVGRWNLLQPFEDFDWIQKQSINAVAYALLALDSGGYETADPTIRSQCVAFLLDKQLEDGGWSIFGARGDVDITAITLQGLAPYREDPAVSNAAERGFQFLSAAQKDSGIFETIGMETAESTAQVMLACCAFGIDPGRDPRFQKPGGGALDALKECYVPGTGKFLHRLTDSSPNQQATEQACRALLGYDRLQKGEPFLFDCTDVSPSPLPEPTSALQPDTTAAPVTTTQPAEPTTIPQPETTTTERAQVTTTERAQVTTTKRAEPAVKPAAPTSKPASTDAPATAGTTADSTAMSRAEQTPHTGDNDTAVFALSVFLLSGALSICLLRRKKEATHAS